MNNEISPYDELVSQVDKLKDFIIKQTQFNNELIELIKNNGKMIRMLIEKIETLKKKSPENPGDINTLYQNWDKH